MGSGCGAVGRAVACNTRGPGFESSHQQLLLNIYLLLTVCRKDKNKEKRGREWPIKIDLRIVIVDRHVFRLRLKRRFSECHYAGQKTNKNLKFTIRDRSLDIQMSLITSLLRSSPILISISSLIRANEQRQELAFSNQNRSGLKLFLGSFGGNKNWRKVGSKPLESYFANYEFYFTPAVALKHEPQSFLPKLNNC